MIEYKSRRETMMPSLLPFMAVLLCTMGALVLILILIVSDTKGNVIREREEKSAKIAEVSDDVQFMSGELEAVRTKQQSELDRGRRQLAFLEDHISRLQDEAEVLAATAKQIESQLLDTSAQQEQKPTIDSLKGEISKLEKQLDEKSKEEANKPPAFAIVPYAGPNGTSRRPIYLECVASGLIVQPEGFLLDMEALRPPYGPGNPLDAVLRLLRSEYEKLDNSFSGASSPYPLLLVRPDGIKSYVYARSAMSGWDDHFGYELIGSDLRLAFPPSRPGTRDKIQATVALAKERQIALLAAMPRAYRNSQDWESGSFDTDEVQDDFNSGPQNANDRSNITSSTTWEMIEELPTDAMNRMNKSPGGTGKIQISQTPRGARSPTSQLVGSMAGESPLAEATPGESSLERENIDGSNVPASEPGRSYAGMFGSDASVGETYVASDAAIQGGSGNSGSSNKQSSNGKANVVPNQAGASQNFAGQNAGSTTSFGESGQTPYMPSNNGNGGMNQPFGNDDPLTNPSQAMSQFASQKQSSSVAPTPITTRSSARDAAGQKPNDSSPSSAPRNARDKQKTSPSKDSMNTVGGQWRNIRSRQNQTPVVREIHIHVLPDRWLVADDLDLNRVDTAIDLSQGPSAAGNKLSTIVDDRINLWGQAIADGYWMPKVITHCYAESGSSMDRLAWILKRLNLEFENSATAYPLPK